MFHKSTPFKQVCELLLSLIVAVILSFGSDFFVYIKFYNSLTSLINYQNNSFVKSEAGYKSGSKTMNKYHFQDEVSPIAWKIIGSKMPDEELFVR